MYGGDSLNIHSPSYTDFVPILRQSLLLWHTVCCLVVLRGSCSDRDQTWGCRMQSMHSSSLSYHLDETSSYKQIVLLKNKNDSRKRRLWDETEEVSPRFCD